LVVLQGREEIVPLASMQERMPSALLEHRRRELLQAITGHKAAIRRHREQLQDTKAALVQLEAKCRELGIRFSVQE
jgi:hypothetical protein